jgi:PAS domain S-box-containing protein
MKNMLNKPEKSATAGQKAMGLLKKKPSRTRFLFSEAETRKLIQNLEFQQLELELQNYELLTEGSVAKDIARKYAVLYDSAPSGYFTLSKDGTIIELNLRGSNLLGNERTCLKNSLFGFFITDDTKPVFNQFLERVFSSKTTESCELIVSANGQPAMNINVTGIAIEGKEECFVSVVDITERIKAEAEISISENRYRRIFESAKDGILILEAETGKIVDVNPFLIDLLGYSKEQIIQKKIWKIGFFKDIVENKDKFHEFQQMEYLRYEDVPLETADRRKINVEFICNAYFVDKMKMIQCNVRNISLRHLC